MRARAHTHKHTRWASRRAPTARWGGAPSRSPLHRSPLTPHGATPRALRSRPGRFDVVYGNWHNEFSEGALPAAQANRHRLLLQRHLADMLPADASCVDHAETHAYIGEARSSASCAELVPYCLHVPHGAHIRAKCC